jgi:hypothetical protein
VRDTKEHDEIIERLTDFADRGYEVGDIEGYKASKAVVDDTGLTFDSCAKFAQNLLLLRVDAQGLLKLSDELTGKDLTAKSIRRNIDFNEELVKRGIMVEIQEEIRDAANKYGDPATILEMVNASGGLLQIASEVSNANRALAQAKDEKDQVQREKERLENQNIAYKSYIDIARLLVMKYGFDISSLDELLSLAGKHGSPVGVIRDINIFNETSELQTRLREVQTKLSTTEEDLANKETILKTKEENLAKANQLLGKIQANQAQSFRLQIVSDLIRNPKEAEATMNELAGIILVVLLGIREYADYHKQESEKFRGKVGIRLNWVIEALQSYAR